MAGVKTLFTITDEANAQFDRLYRRYGDDDSYYINMRCPVNMQKTLFQRVLDFLR